MEIGKLASALGAEVSGMDLSGHLGDDDVAAVRSALLSHQVLVFRGVEMSPAQHLALAEQFGKVEVHAFFPNLGEGFERISVLDAKDGTASMWHTDETFLEAPPLGTLLHAQTVPPVGGDTLWASCRAAYEDLSEPMRRHLEELTAVHDLSRVVELKYKAGKATSSDWGAAIAADRRFDHPVVRTHPDTMSKSLFVNPTYTRHITGLPSDESEALLLYLYRHMTTERYIYRHRWRAGDLIIWDNRCTMHNVCSDFRGDRVMYRASIVGDNPY